LNGAREQSRSNHTEQSSWRVLESENHQQ
jgi:hypothetical protein